LLGVFVVFACVGAAVYGYSFYLSHFFGGFMIVL
jgi:hypothetical protein